MHDPRYKDLPETDLPCPESLKDTVTRFMPYWTQALAPSLRAKERLMVAAHGNTLRALVKYLENISDAEIPKLEIPTGIPFAYELNEQREPTARYCFGDSLAAVEAKKALDHVVRVSAKGH